MSGSRIDQNIHTKTNEPRKIEYNASSQHMANTHHAQ